MEFKRSTISSTGFFYDENIRDYKKDPLPRHVESLRQSMLNFACLDCDLVTEEDIGIQRQAARLEAKQCNEPHFKSFFERHFFEPLLQHSKVSEKGKRGVSRYIPDDDNIILDLDVQWGAFDKKIDDIVSAPKPDLAFYVPMYHLAAKPHIPTTTGNRLSERHEESTPSTVEPFSWTTLKELHANGLRLTPFNEFKIKASKGQDLRCYPWLIVEYKRATNNKSEFERLSEVASCQAANASGCAVRLCQNAARFAVELEEDAQIPPIPAITTVGAEVKVWLTYFAKDFMAYYSITPKQQRYERVKEGHMMQCIWTGNMTNTDDILKFRLILENTSFWGTRVFRPLMATYIDHWRFVYHESTPLYGRVPTTRQQERMGLSKDSLRMVTRALSAQPHVKGDDGSHEAIKIKIIKLCDSFFQDVDRIIEEELQSSELHNREGSCSDTSRRGAHTRNGHAVHTTRASIDGSNSDNDLADFRRRRSRATDSEDLSQSNARRPRSRSGSRGRSRPSDAAINMATWIGRTRKIPWETTRDRY